MKEKSVNLTKLTPIEKCYTQQIIRPQDVVTYYKVEEKTLETTVKKEADNREVQAIKDQQDVLEGLIEVKKYIITDQNLHEEINVDVKETGNFSKATQDGFEEDEVRAKDKVKVVSAFEKLNKVIMT
jgi:hypothetical protein